MGKPFLDREAVAVIGGVKPGTVKQYEVDSKPGGRFAGDPFPKRDGTVGRSPWWSVEREREIRDWFDRHPRTRKGLGYGGRPRKTDR